jgi:hypothetical protein
MADFAQKASDLDPCYIEFKKQFPEMHKDSYVWKIWLAGWKAGMHHALKEEMEPVPFGGWL